MDGETDRRIEGKDEWGESQREEHTVVLGTQIRSKQKRCRKFIEEDQNYVLVGVNSLYALWVSEKQEKPRIQPPHMGSQLCLRFALIEGKNIFS